MSLRCRLVCLSSPLLSSGFSVISADVSRRSQPAKVFAVVQIPLHRSLHRIVLGLDLHHPRRRKNRSTSLRRNSPNPSQRVENQSLKRLSFLAKRGTCCPGRPRQNLAVPSGFPPLHNW